MPGGLASRTQEAGPPRRKGKSGLCGSYAPRARQLEMPVGNGLHGAMRRLVMPALRPAGMLRPGVMRPGMVRRGRRHMMMGCGFGFRGGEHGGSGDCAEDGDKTEQERTAAEARAFGTLHDDLLVAAELLQLSDFRWI